tara:strand:+ start:1133 stop:1387 length:255 start_codon:yes stop_codon:yes gene_type:complete
VPKLAAEQLSYQCQLTRSHIPTCINHSSSMAWFCNGKYSLYLALMLAHLFDRIGVIYLFTKTPSIRVKLKLIKEQVIIEINGVD